MHASDTKSVASQLSECHRKEEEAEATHQRALDLAGIPALRYACYGHMSSSSTDP